MQRTTTVLLAVIVREILVVAAQYSNETITAIVERHNFFRERTQPPATDMRKMSWDHELAYLAQQYSKECKLEHSSEEFRTTERFGDSIGENILKTGQYSMAVLFFEGIGDWFEEYKNYDYNSATCTKTPCGHYTQMVWAQTYKVGCGATDCGSNGKVMVCHYHPRGNSGGVPYQMGTPPCSKCLNDVCGGSLGKLCTNTERDAIVPWNWPTVTTTTNIATSTSKPPDTQESTSLPGSQNTKTTSGTTADNEIDWKLFYSDYHRFNKNYRRTGAIGIGWRIFVGFMAFFNGLLVAALLHMCYFRDKDGNIVLPRNFHERITATPGQQKTTSTSEITSECHVGTSNSVVVQ